MDTDLKKFSYLDFMDKISNVAPTPFNIISHKNMLKNPQNQTINNFNYLNYIVREYVNKSCTDIWEVIWFFILSDALPENVKDLFGQMSDWIIEYKNNPDLAREKLLNIMKNAEKIYNILLHYDDEKHEKVKRAFKHFAWALERFWLYTQDSTYIIKIPKYYSSSSKFYVSSGYNSNNIAINNSYNDDDEDGSSF